MHSGIEWEMDWDHKMRVFLKQWHAMVMTLTNEKDHPDSITNCSVSNRGSSAIAGHFWRCLS